MSTRPGPVAESACALSIGARLRASASSTSRSPSSRSRYRTGESWPHASFFGSHMRSRLRPGTAGQNPVRVCESAQGDRQSHARGVVSWLP